MNLDVFTLSALVDEFLDVLVGGKVQDAIDVDETSIGLEVYSAHQRRYLYISADPLTPRVHLLDEKLRRGLNKPTQIGLLLRRFVEGARIEHVSQPRWERVLQLDLHGPEGAVSIIAEPMERRSNLLLIQGGVILDCIRRVGADENRFRVSLPAQPYVPPPPQSGKREPLSVSAADIEALLRAENDPKRKTLQTLTAHLLGMSPLLAKEIVYRATGDANHKAAQTDGDRLYNALREVVTPLQNRDWQPGIAETDEGVQAYSVYALRSLPGWHSVASVSAALTAYYGAPVGPEAYKAGKTPLLEALHEARAKLSAKLASLRRSLTDDSERETWRRSGELILAYQYTLRKGQDELRAHYDPDQPELAIRLDPTLSPLENAQRYFERYNKAKRALEDVPALVTDTETELAYLAQLETDLELASNWPEIDEVQQALQSKGYWRGKAVKRLAGGSQSAPLRFVKDGFVLWVGRNSRQNDIVTFEKGRALDTWLHARDVPGAHVVIRFDGRPIPETLIQQAAALAAHFSAKRDETRVLVDVTQVKYVRKIKGAAPGMVTYRNETTCTVIPRGPDIFEER
ncbi:MAG: fibronectin/fibrinogen-binding protein [Chloroflexi bacterium]|nr:fibronectin/fibrinogen-binding protein [Chloroflexota bacterium]